ncbi:hypothetical protein Tco_0164337 [Tanacetum coccineum]
MRFNLNDQYFKNSEGKKKFVPIKQASVSIRTKPITVSQPHVITKKDVNSDSNGLSSIGVDNTTKTRRPQHRSNTKTDRVPSASKSSCIKNKEVKVEEHHRNLLDSKNKKHMSSQCNNIKLVIRNDKSKVVCAMCKQCLITTNHDVCVLKYVNDMNSCGVKHNDNVSKIANQKKHKPKVKKPKKVGSKERLASPTPSKPRTCLRWSPTGRMFNLKGKIITSSESECQSDSSRGHLNLFMVRRLGVLKAYDRRSEASHKFHLEAEAIATACYTQNCSIIHCRFDKTPYELINGIKPYISYLHVFGALCYPKNDRDDIRKLGAKAMYDDYISGQPSSAIRTALVAKAPQVLQTPTTSTTTADTALTPKYSSSQAAVIPNTL